MNLLNIFGLLLIMFHRIDGASVVNANKKPIMNIAIVGAGPAGISSAKNVLDHGYNVTIFEQNDELGGTWVYSGETGKNKYGLNVHSAMYEGLSANSPYQMMVFPNHTYPSDVTSFPTQVEVLNYLHSYADRFKIKPHIKYHHLVIRVLPIENDKWKVIAKNLQDETFSTNIFDAIFVCNGHFSIPNIPKIDGASEFNGKIVHSRDFHKANDFRDQKVLIIGAGITGPELAVILSNIAKEVTLSHNRGPDDELRRMHENALPTTIHKDKVKRIFADGAEFIDGTKKTFTSIIYATSYKPEYPFLSIDSGIRVDDNFVQPLYIVVNFFCFDLQARSVLKYWSGEKKLPSKTEMLSDLRNDIQSQRNKGFPQSKTHFFLFNQLDYIDELAKTADIEKIPIVYENIWEKSLLIDILKRPYTFRNYKYTIIDSETFTKKSL